jgi:hypothetical protein
METAEKSFVSDDLQITQERALEIMVKVFNLWVNDEDVSTTLKKLVCDFELNTKELVLASFFVGRMQEEGFLNFITKQVILSKLTHGLA